MGQGAPYGKMQHMVKCNSGLQTKMYIGTNWTQSHKPESGVDSGKIGL